MHWTVAEHDGIAVATFTRPPRNFMSFAGIEQLGQTLRALGDREDISAVVLTGGVPGFFVAHADLEDLGRLGRGEPTEGDPRAWTRTLRLVEEIPQPVVAAINGQCWGGGCELALACTVRVAAASATLAQPEIAVGIIPGAGGTQRLPRLIGPGRALELILTGRVVDAEEALGAGIVEAVLPDAGFLDAALGWTRRMTVHPRPALAAAKRAVLDGLRLPFTDGIRLEAQLFARCQSDPTALELQQAVLRRYAEAPPDVTVQF